MTLKVDGTDGLRFALAYGFRNIQTLARKLKRGTTPYHYVEVMACPSGCLNGGGQPKPTPGKTSQDVLQEVEAKYHHEVGAPGSRAYDFEFLIVLGISGLMTEISPQYGNAVKELVLQADSLAELAGSESGTSG